jgi:hypothetical protein
VEREIFILCNNKISYKYYSGVGEYIVKVVKCEKCGETYQIDDADDPSSYQCTNCNGDLKPLKIEKEGIKDRKPLILIAGVIIFLILIVGILWALTPTQDNTTNANLTEQTTADSQSQPATTQASWHTIATYTKEDIDTNTKTPSFTTKGNQFKVIIAATIADENYYVRDDYTLDFTVNRASDGGEVSSDMLKGFSSPNKGEFDVYADPGKYYIGINKVGFKEINIQIVDYY